MLCLGKVSGRLWSALVWSLSRSKVFVFGEAVRRPVDVEKNCESRRGGIGSTKGLPRTSKRSNDT